MSASARNQRTVLVTVFLAVLMLVGMASTAAAAEQQRNPDCLLCHETTQQFDTIAVDKDTVCSACHTPGLLGTHPYHQPGANCGAYCHPGWGESLLSAVPAYLTSAGSFASPVSQDTTSGVIHLIHSQPRWPANIDTSVSACSSCHSAAACDACHTNGLSPVHEAHGTAANPPHTRTVGYGIIGEDQLIKSAVDETEYCGTSDCHDLSTLESNAPLMKEDFSHDAYPEYGYPEANVVTKVGNWRTQRGTSFTGGQMSLSNVANSTLEVSFTGNKVILVSDLDPYRGRAEVWIDGSYVDTIDTYSATTKYQRVVWQSNTLSNGPHTIMVKVLGTKQGNSRAAYFNVDAFKVFAPLRDLIAPDCDESCHSDKSSGHGGSFTHEATQTAGTYPAGRFTCTQCHSLSMWTEHARASSKSEPDGCAACHTTYADYTLDEYVNPATTGYGSCTWAGDGSVTGCHQVANGQDPHNFTDTDHDASGIGATADCRSCHGDDLSVIHDDTNAARGQHASLVGNGWATDCLTCHGPEPTFPTTLDCTDAGCHVNSGVVSMATHPAPAHNGTDNNADVLRTGGENCSACHLLELTSEHGKTSSVTDPGAAAIGCTDCHNATYFPAGWLDTPGTSNTCNACHDPAGAVDAGLPHEALDYSSKHNWSSAPGCGGIYCHDGDTPWLGNITAVDVLHDASKPGAGDCTSCHDTNTAVPDETLCTDCHSSHTDVGPAHDARAIMVPANADCVTCHAAYVGLAFGHSGDCASCHENATLTATATRYIGNAYDLACTSCHNSTDLGTYDYQPYDPNHYDPYLTEHTANYGADTVPTGGSVVTTKPCAACHANSLKAEHLLTLSSGNIDCFDCHTSTAPIDAVTVINADWPNDKCGDCHGANHGGTGQAIHDMSASAASLGCSAGGCHPADSDDIAKLHGDANDGSNTSCNVCHTTADTDLSAISGCDDCHSGGAHDMTVHEVTTDTGNCLRCHGDDGAPADDVRGIHADCDQCHDNSSYPGITGGNTSDCVSCHNDGEVAEPDNDPDGDYSPYDPNHYNGSEATHTVSAAQATATYDGFACQECHKTEMKPEHFKSSSAFPDVPGTYAEKCEDCHESEVDALGTWDNTCAACHATNHTERATKHDASGLGNADSCDGSGCHVITDVAALHDNSATNSTTAADANRCAVCHTDNNAVPTKLACNSAGCHGASTPQSHQHQLDLASSTYDNGTESGCADSGAGCHVQNSTGYLNYHTPSATCLSSTCHVSSDHWDPAYDNPNTCQNCHSGNYENAPDNVSITQAEPAGHYSEALHTAGGMATAVDVGGTTTAACTVCHNPTDASGIDALYYQHQALQTLGDTTCSDCHNANVNVTAEIAASWTTNTCADCHNATDLPLYAQHGTTAGSAAGSSVDGCTATGCHSTDLHDIHKGDGVGGDPACTVCHDDTKQGWNPTDTTCGASGACHTSGDPHPGAGPAHTASASAECVDCHEYTDIRTTHSDSCSYCHGNASYPTLPGASAECVDCHKDGAGFPSEPHDDPNGDYSPADPNHYNGTEATHTADNAGDVGFSNTDGYSCVTCHKQEMKPEHFKSSSSFPDVPGTYADKCIDCHESEVDGFAGAWNDDCIACHATGATHTLFNGKHNATATWDTSCGGGGCHDTDNVDLIHKNSVASNATVTTCVNTCHTDNDTVPTSVSCDTSGCHSGTGHGHELDVAGSVGCNDTGAGCHASTATDYASTDYHPANGCTAGNCHAAANRGDAAYDNPNACQTCHDGTYNGAPDTVPTSTATPAGHYGATLHDIGLFQGVVKGTSDGQTTAVCNDCHSRDDTGDGLVGLYTQHQGLDDKGDVTCQECHNAYPTEVANSWPTPSCGDCHNGTDMPDPGDTRWGHAGSIAPAGINGTGSGCVTSGCHQTWDLHTLHKGDGVGSDPACSVCHDYSGQGAKPTQTSCGVGNDCHNTSPTHPNEDDAHDVAIAGDAGDCVDCHEETDIRIQHSNNCATCHNGGSNLGSGNTADCITCHDGDTAGGDVYYDGADNPVHLDHYTEVNTPAHTESGQISTQSWGTSSYLHRLEGFYPDTDAESIDYNVPCSSCHTSDLYTEHTKSTIDGLGGYANECVSCHELRVDAWGSVWDNSCGGNADTCHDVDAFGNLHQTVGSGWDEKHDASAWTLTSGGSTFGSGGGALGPGFSDGFESNDFSNWDSADSGSGGWATVFSEDFANISDWTINSGSWAAVGPGAQGSGISLPTQALRSNGAANTNTRIDSNNTFDLSGYSAARVTLQLGCQVDHEIWAGGAGSGDRFDLELRSGASTYLLSVANAGNNGSEPGSVVDVDAWGNATEQFQQLQVMLPAGWLSDLTNTSIRLVTDVSDASQNEYFYVDDLLVEGQTTGAGGWSVQSTTVNAGTYAANAEGTGPQWYYLTKTGIDNSNASSVDVSYDIRWDSLESADDVVVQYTTTGGAPWTDIKNYAPAAADPSSLGWTSESYTGLPAGINGIRFGFYADNAAGDNLYVDAVDVTPQAAGGGSTATSCQNNPNGEQCHDVSDVADIHARLANDGCPTCHTGTFDHPTIKNCQASGCHVGVNLDEHIENGSSTQNHHESDMSTTALFGTGFTGDWCTGCHDDSIANEHFELSAYTSTPCSMCHKKTSDSSGPTVTAAATLNEIDTAGAGGGLCTDCHGTVTKSAPHVQRPGDGGTPGTQFADGWYGHRVYNSLAGAYGTWGSISRPSDGSYLLTGNGWSSTSMVRCNDCHGDMTGTTGPHGASMSVNYASNPNDSGNPYNNSYTTGNLDLATSWDDNGQSGDPLCAKCHQANTRNYNSGVHGQSGDHSTGKNSGTCTMCHMKVPHAWKRPRLIGYTTDAAPFQSTGLQAIRTNPGSWWDTGDCGATCYSDHNLSYSNSGTWK